MTASIKTEMGLEQIRVFIEASEQSNSSKSWRELSGLLIATLVGQEYFIQRKAVAGRN